MSEIIIPIRTSERTCFKTCRWQWKMAYIEHWSSKAPKSALAFGSLFHDSMEYFYKPGKKRGAKPWNHFLKAYREYLDAGYPPIVVGQGRGEEPLMADELGVEMLKNYVDEYGQDDRYEVIAPEQTFQIDVNHPKSGRYLFTYVGTFDAVIRDLHTRKIGFMEHKTGASLEPFGAPMALDEQAGSYWAYGPDWLRHQGVLRENEECDFILYNRCRKAFKDTRPKNEQGHALNKPLKGALVEACRERGLAEKGVMIDLEVRLLEGGMSVRELELLGEVSKNQPAPLFKREVVYRGDAERRRLMIRVMQEAKEMKMAREGKLACYKNPGKQCGFCEFRDVCEVHETGSDWMSLLKAGFEKWEPYGDHQENLSDDGVEVSV